MGMIRDGDSTYGDDGVKAQTLQGWFGMYLTVIRMVRDDRKCLSPYRSLLSLPCKEFHLIYFNSSCPISMGFPFSLLLLADYLLEHAEA